LGYEWVCERIRQVEGFPRDLAMQLKHIILSHHGEYEYGSPKRPKTLEALLVHHLDNLCARVAHFRETVDRELGEGQSGLTGYQRLVGRVLYRPKRRDPSKTPPRGTAAQEGDHAAPVQEGARVLGAQETRDGA